MLIQLAQLIITIDEKLKQQLDVIMDNENLQQLMKSWYAMHNLIESLPTTHNLLIKLLDIQQNELENDLINALDFQQSTLFNKLYNYEYDQAGGQPFGLLMTLFPFELHRKQCIVLDIMLRICEMCFTIFLITVSPAIFGIKNFQQFTVKLNLGDFFKQDIFCYWNKLRKQAHAAFAAIMIPDYYVTIKSKYFPLKKTLAIPAVVALVIDIGNTFLNSGWFLQDYGDTSKALSLCSKSMLNYDEHLLKQFKNNHLAFDFTDHQENTFFDLGINCLRQHIWHQQYSIHNKVSCQHSVSKRSDYPISMTDMLCISRFAHYLKMILRNKIGKITTAEQCEIELQNWILQYCADITHRTAQNAQQYPLKTAKIQVRQHKQPPYQYRCVAYLELHHHIEFIETKIQFFIR